ncbi:hypothetical protein PMAYCL1PPCAC_31612, partial [Pristionchus mayeri]
ERHVTAIECLRSCIGKKIKKVELIGADFDSLCILLKSVQFEQLHLTFIDFSDKQLCKLYDFVESRQVDHLTLSVASVSVSDPVNVLCKFAARFRSLHIHQTHCEVDKESAYLFGLYNTNWASIVLDMFTKTMDTLRITNLHYPNYLKAGHEDILAKNLPTLKRKMWFEATGRSVGLEGIDFEYFDHQVKSYFVPGMVGRQALSIKHVSRLKEQFD